MKQKLPFVFFLIALVLASLACTVFVGGPDTSDLTPIPISSEEAVKLQDQIKQAFEAGAESGIVTFTITEAQITSLLAQRLQSDPTLQSDSKPIITEPQVYLRDGQVKIYGKTQQGMFAANIGIVVNVSVDENGKPKIEIVSADFGPLPAPDTIKAAFAAMIDEAFTGAVGPAAVGLRIESITIADGLMTITGRTK
jgi:hypothetical protein